jgi:hypothetical protein
MDLSGENTILGNPKTVVLLHNWIIAVMFQFVMINNAQTYY